jgi:hypothetical protein
MAKRLSNSERTEISAAMLSEIEKLPQYPYMKDSHIERWIHLVLENEPDRAMWHVKRLSGFGGSDIGALVNSMNDDNNYFNSAYSIVAQKLCIVAPGGGDKHTRRGVYLEDFVRQRFEAQLTERGIAWRRIDEERKKLEQTVNLTTPWIRSSMDEAYHVILEDGTIEKWVVDFKVPTGNVIENYKKTVAQIKAAAGGDVTSPAGDRIPNTTNRAGIGLNDQLPIADYISQLHHYAEDARQKGFQFDRIILAPFDFDDGASVLMLDIEYDPVVVANNLSAGYLFWDEYVLQGRLPDPDRKAEISDTIPDDALAAKMLQFAQLKVLGSKIDAKMDAVRSDIEDEVARMGSVLDGKLRCNGIDVKGNLVLDESRIQTRLQELQVPADTQDGLRNVGTYDTAKMKASWHEFQELFGDLLQGLRDKDMSVLRSSIANLDALRAKLPEKEKGKLNVEKVKEFLLSIGEDPALYMAESLQTMLVKGKNDELSLVKATVDEKFENFMMFVASELQIHEQTEPTNGLSA